MGLETSRRTDLEMKKTQMVRDSAWKTTQMTGCLS